MRLDRRRVSIPHLNEIDNQYKGKGLVIIGQDSWQRDERMVAPFVKRKGDKWTEPWWRRMRILRA